MAAAAWKAERRDWDPLIGISGDTRGLWRQAPPFKRIGNPKNLSRSSDLPAATYYKRTKKGEYEMNREIKFRAIDNETGELVDLSKVSPGEAFQYYEDGNGSLNRCRTETLMQYTGLKDKNGVEIYEGDIISDHIGIGVVRYSAENAAFRVVYADGNAKWFLDYTLKGERESLEVISNTYEFHKLLGGNNEH